MSNQPYPQLGATFYPGGSDDFYMPEVISPSPQRFTPEVPQNMQENLAHLELEANAPRSHSGPVSPVNHDMNNFPNRQSSVAPAAPPPQSVGYSQYNGGGNGYDNSGNNRPTNYDSGNVQGYENNQMNSGGGNAVAGNPHTQSHAAMYGHSGSYSNLGESSRSIPVSEPKFKYEGVQGSYTKIEQPSFSPFPKLKNPPPNIPPSDDDKEITLEIARIPVLNSNDAEMQLAWAQDALAFVEVAAQYDQRMSDSNGARPNTPQVEHQLRVDAISVVSFLAEQHHPKAEFMRGMWLEFGKFGFRVDRKEAYWCYTRAAEKGYSRAEYRIGMQYESSNDITKALRHYQSGVSLGDSASNYRLGMMTLLGQHGQKQDYAKGVQLIRYSAQTADENAPQGAYVYGMLLSRQLESISIPEIFLPLDLKAAKMNIEKAAYLGFAKAQQKMGEAYELCLLGCEFDPALSLHYNALASRQGEPDADMAISKWFLCGYDGVFEKNEELAFNYAEKAANAGLSTAEFAMGYFHEIGMHTSVDLKKAREWYQKAAERGNNDAIGRLESLSKSQTLSKKDHENIAISRIKSQYGSTQGGRPERFTNPVSHMPSIVDEDHGDRNFHRPGTASMPDPSIRNTIHATDGNYLNPLVKNLPPRSASVAPYPEDGPLVHRPNTASGFINPNLIDRPSTAFQINTGQRNYNVGAPTRRGNSMPYPEEGPTRPYSSMDGMGRGGRPIRGGMGAPGAPAGRVVSSQGAPGYRQSQGALPPQGVGRGGYPGQGWQGGPNGSGRPQQQDNMPQGPKIDIGFSAPPDPADKRGKLQKNNAPQGQGKPQPMPPGQDASPPRATRPSVNPPGTASRVSRQNSLPHSAGSSVYSQPSPTAQRPSQQQQPQQQQQQQQQQRRPSPAQYPQSQSQQQGRPQQTGKPQPRPAGPTSTASAPAATLPQRAPGKGPKTFEEMGVPAGKKKDDCAVM